MGGRPQPLHQPLNLGGIDRDPRQFLELLTALQIGELGGGAPQHPGRAGRAAADQAQDPVQRKAALGSGGMVVVARQGEGAEHAEHLAAAAGVATLAGLPGHLRHRHLGEHDFQKATTVFQQGGAQGLFDPLGGQRLTRRQPLVEELQERFGFVVALALDLLEFFYGRRRPPAVSRPR